MAFTCWWCGMTSHNSNDELHEYCAACHEFMNMTSIRRTAIPKKHTFVTSGFNPIGARSIVIEPTFGDNERPQRLGWEEPVTEIFVSPFEIAWQYHFREQLSRQDEYGTGKRFEIRENGLVDPHHYGVFALFVHWIQQGEFYALHELLKNLRNDMSMRSWVLDKEPVQRMNFLRKEARKWAKEWEIRWSLG